MDHDEMHSENRGPAEQQQLSPEELRRRFADVDYLRRLSIVPDEELIAGRIRPWLDHPLFRFSRPEAERTHGSARSGAGSPLLPSGR